MGHQVNIIAERQAHPRTAERDDRKRRARPASHEHHGGNYALEGVEIGTVLGTVPGTVPDLG